MLFDPKWVDTKAFKSSRALGIKKRDFDSLVTVLGMLESGQIPEKEFDMSCWFEVRSCGSVRCIGGWTEFVAGRELFLENYRTSELYELFYPSDFSCLPYQATIAQAAKALRNYLTTGDAKWHEVMS